MSCQIIAAQYTDGKLIKVNTFDVNNLGINKSTEQITVPFENDITSAKIFIWDMLNTQIPVYTPTIIK